MKRSEYLDHPYVSDFITWSTDLVSGQRDLTHSWNSGKFGRKEFTSLFNAVGKYEWNGSSFEDVVAFFNECRNSIQLSMTANPVAEEDRRRFFCTSKRIAEWGGINYLPKLDKMGMNALTELSREAELLKPECANTSKLAGVKHMGSGFSKIYSAMIEDFPIYDSRVACALTSLIRIFLDENGVGDIPETLKLGIPLGRSVQVRGGYGFPTIQGAQVRKYAESNLKAAWILGFWADQDGRFMTEFPKRQVRIMALHSALFMLGYAPLTEHPS